ncbi:MAG: DinB family protein [Gemmatimonadaceae bacterium]
MPKTATRSRKSSKSAKKGQRKPVRKSARKSARKSTISASKQSPLAMLYPDLESELETTRRMLARVPNGQNDWRPHTKSRTLGELATHLAQLPGFALLMVTQDVFEGNPAGRGEPRLVTSADRVALFDELSAQLKGVLQQMTWDRANASWSLRGGGRTLFSAPRGTVLRTVFLTHSAHHRAQLGVYLRLLETPVPWSYGPSADEQLPPAP